MHREDQPGRRPLRIHFLSRALTDGIPVDADGYIVLRSGDATYDVEYDRAVYAYHWHGQPMPYADEVSEDEG